MTLRLVPPPTKSEQHILVVDGEELDTILAALCLWNKAYPEQIKEMHHIASRCGDHQLQTRDEILDLIEKLSQ